jgi:hypothetical protein
MIGSNTDQGAGLAAKWRKRRKKRTHFSRKNFERQLPKSLLKTRPGNPERWLGKKARPSHEPRVCEEPPSA